MGWRISVIVGLMEEAGLSRAEIHKAFKLPKSGG